MVEKEGIVWIIGKCVLEEENLITNEGLTEKARQSRASTRIARNQEGEVKYILGNMVAEKGTEEAWKAMW